MITKELCQEVLQHALQTGGDFAEIFANRLIITPMK